MYIHIILRGECIPLDNLRGSFSSLHVDHNPRYSAGKAPHTPVLLLSLIYLHKNDRADLSAIRPDLALRETWAQLWSHLDYPKPGPIYLPLYHMRSEGFWDQRLKEGVSPHQPKSLSGYEDMVDSASLDPALVAAIGEPESRNELVNALLHGGYFSDPEIERLRAGIAELDESFVYEERLSRQVREEFAMDHIDDPTGLDPVRNPAFRRQVLTAYDETCAACGLRLRTSTGASVIDAAHILPFHMYHNDDPRNGLALCKTHHWLLDKGLISVDNRYRILVSPAVEAERPPGALTDLRAQELVLPAEAGRYPSQVALEWHRGAVYVR